MKKIRNMLMAAAALGLSACASVDQTGQYEGATRASVVPQPVLAPQALSAYDAISVGDIRVIVPRSLKVNEANRYYPGGDIVWREDPIGDRHLQVATILRDGIANGVAPFMGPREVDMLVELTRFHALSEKARYSIGGVHAIQFYLTVLDAATGDPLTERKLIQADFDALGGQAAIAAEARGITQKTRIEQHLARVIEVELATDDGYHGTARGLVAAINQL